MKQSRSKRAGLSVLHEDDFPNERAIESETKAASTFTSFFTRNRRINSPSTALDNGQQQDLQNAPEKRTLRRNSLGSRQYKSMSRSMNDLGSMLSRTESTASLRTTNTTHTHTNHNSTSSPLASSIDLSPSKKSPSKRKDMLPFPQDSIIKQGWLNKRGQKKETNSKLQRVYIRNSKLYAYKPPADLSIRSFDLELHRMRPSLEETTTDLSSLHPLDFQDKTRELLFESNASTTRKRYSSVDMVQELYANGQSGVLLLAFLTEQQIIFCHKVNTPNSLRLYAEGVLPVKAAISPDLWLVESVSDLIMCEFELKQKMMSSESDYLEIRIGQLTRTFISRQPAQISALLERCIAQKAHALDQARPSTAPDQIIIPSTEAAVNLHMVDELFTVRQIVRDESGKITHGTLSGLCRQILLEKLPIKDVNSLSSVLLQTIGLWNDTKIIVSELCSQLSILAETATRGRAEQIVTFLLERAPSLLLDSGNVESLLTLIGLASEKRQQDLKEALWARRTNLLAIITMDFSQQGSPVSYQSELSWMAEYQSLSNSGLQAESILAIPANLFAEQLHIFHLYYLKHWDPAQDEALFFNTESKGASRNPLVFGPHRMHFLTSTIMNHILALDTRPISVMQRAAICTQWILIGMMLKRMGDMAGWLAVVMALCAPPIVRLKQMWSVVEDRLHVVVEKEWSPVMRDLFRRTIGVSAGDQSSAHVLAPDADTASYVQEVVPFYGDLCDAIEITRSKVSSVNKGTTCVDVGILKNVRELLRSALESYALFMNERDPRTMADFTDDRSTVIPAIQDCFKQLNSMPLEIVDVCSHALLDASLQCEPARMDNLVDKKNASTHDFRTGAYLPLLFNDLLPSYRLFDVSVLLDIGDQARRSRPGPTSTTTRSQSMNTTALRRLNSFPPTQKPVGHTTGHGYLDEITRAKAAASVGQWKMLSHIKDLAGVSDRIVTFMTGDLVLKDAEHVPESISRRRPQSMLVESRKRDSVVSRRGSLQFPENHALEQDSDLVIRPQNCAPRGPGVRELTVKAATLDTMFDLLMFNIIDIRYLQIASAPVEHFSMESISLDRAEFMRIFLVSFRAYCTPTFLMKTLIQRLMKAESVSRITEDFPNWVGASSSAASSQVINWALLEKVFTGIFEVISTWMSLVPGDFIRSGELLKLLEHFLSKAHESVSNLDAYDIEDSSACIWKDISSSNLRRIYKQFLRVCHRPQSWKLPRIESDMAEIYEPFALSRIITLDDACSSVNQLNDVIACAFKASSLEDWMCCFEHFENQTLDSQAFFPRVNDAIMLDHDADIHDVLWLIGNVNARGFEMPLQETLPYPIQKLITLRKAITIWTIQQVADPEISLDSRVSRIQTLLELIKVSCTYMSTLDINVTTDSSTTTQVVPSFIATAVAAGLVSAQTRTFSYTWHLVAQGRGQTDASGDIASLLPPIHVTVPQSPIIPCLAWLFDRMLEVACYIPDKVNEDPKLLNFDKRRYIFNLLANLDIVDSTTTLTNVLNEVDNPFLFILSPPKPLADWKVLRSAAYRENQLARNIRLCRPFSSLISQEHEKYRREVRCRDHIDRQAREVQKSALRKRADGSKYVDIERRATRAKYGMNSLLRAVRPISVAISGNWTPEKASGIGRVVAPEELPDLCIIPKGTRPSLTIDLVHSVTQIVDTKQHLFSVTTEDGMENHFQAPTSTELEEWVDRLKAAALSGAKKRITTIKEDAKLRVVEEAPQFSPRTSVVIDVVTATFAVDLATLIRREGSSIPKVAILLMDEVERRGLQEVGIYRISGSFSTVNTLKAAFNSGAPVDLSDGQWSDINAVAGVFKLWLRELPEPLMTYQLYDSFLATLDIEDYNTKSLSLKELIHQLPVPNFSLLKRLIEHLERITDHEETNHMYAHNLAIIFGPNILQPIPSNLSFAASMKDLGKVQTIIRNIIFQCHWIFSTEDENELGAAPTPGLSSIQELTNDI